MNDRHLRNVVGPPNGEGKSLTERGLRANLRITPRKRCLRLESVEQRNPLRLDNLAECFIDTFVDCHGRSR